MSLGISIIPGSPVLLLFGLLGACFV